MYRQYSLLLVFPMLITIGFLYLHLGGEGQDQIASEDTINRVIGDESFIEVYGIKPDEGVPERIRIKTHLQYVEQLLRTRSIDHLSDEQRKNRTEHLDQLREYILAGEFPHNDGHPDLRRPTFISNNGHICAVGYLIEQDLGRVAVEAINRKFKYQYITEIDDPAFVKWVENSGFTLRELAMIQPAYRPTIVEEVERNENRVGLSYAIGSSVLAGANILYHTNRSENPWLFNNSSSNHWFGLAAGSASILLGALNLDSNQSYKEPIGIQDGYTCAGSYCPPLRKVTITNHSRTTLSAVNMGIGLIGIVRSGYHLIRKTSEEKSSRTSLGVTQLEPNPITSGDLIPAVQLNVRF